VYITDAGSLIVLQHVDRLRWALIIKRFLRDITLKAYDYEFLKNSEQDLPVNPKIRSLLNLILSPLITSQIQALPVWGFVKSISIELTNTSLPLDVHVSYAWLQVLFYRMQEIKTLRLIGFTWNPELMDLIKRSCTRQISTLDIDIFLIQEDGGVNWDELFHDLFSNIAKSVEHLSVSSSSDCLNPSIILKLFELKFWKNITVIWKAEVDSGIFQALLSKLLLWITHHPNLEYCKLKILLPRMMENVTIPSSSLMKDRYNISASVDPITKKFSFLVAIKKLNTNIRRSLCISSTSTLIRNESSWTDVAGSGIFLNY
jgi:hypothetical protein